ncbi:MAG TPA: hypothetical protein VF985_01990 [Mariniflexile sp.]|jgi:hypothetical protein
MKAGKESIQWIDLAKEPECVGGMNPLPVACLQTGQTGAFGREKGEFENFNYI